MYILRIFLSEMSSSLSLPDDCNVDAIAGAPEAISNHEVIWKWKTYMG